MQAPERRCPRPRPRCEFDANPTSVEPTLGRRTSSIAQIAAAFRPTGSDAPRQSCKASREVRIMRRGSLRQGTSGMIAIWIAVHCCSALRPGASACRRSSGSWRRASCSARSAWSRRRCCRDLAHAGVLTAPVRRRPQAAHQDAAALRGLGHGAAASARDGRHRCRGVALGGRPRRGSWRSCLRIDARLLEHGARGEGARRQSRAARRARPRRDRHLDRAGRRRGRTARGRSASRRRRLTRYCCCCSRSAAR